MSRAQSALRAWLPPVVVAAALLAHVVGLVLASRARTGGVPSFPIDDAFIHLALAKRLAFDSTYGISPGTFAAASSSIAWPYLLSSSMRIFGDNASIPIVINAIFAVGCVFLLDRGYVALTRDEGVFVRSIVLVFVTWLTPLPVLVVLAMEHTGHAFATLGLLLALQRSLAGAERPRDRWVLPLWALLAMSLRYESLFVVTFVVGLLFFAKKNRALAGITAGAAALPITLFGLYSLSKGQRFFPMSVVLKRRPIRIRDASDITDWLGTDLMQRLGIESFLAVLLLLCLAIAIWALAKRAPLEKLALPVVVALMILTHVEFAALGWFYRYEAYLVFVATFFVTTTVLSLLREAYPRDRSRRERFAFVLLTLGFVLACGAPIGKRALSAIGETPIACQNIFQQQVQNGRFLATYFGKDKVAVNDIGAVAYLGNDRVVDLVGLASLDVAVARRMNFMNPLAPEDIERLTKDVEVAIVYDEWFTDGLPGTWLKLGRWQIQNNKVCAFPGVSIYATRPESAPRVMDALAAFAPTMPPDVFQTGPYLGRVPGEADRIHPGDIIAVDPVRPTDVTGRFTVWPNGQLEFPYCGQIFVGRKTVTEVKQILEGCFAHGAAKAETAGVTLGAVSRGHTEPLEAVVGGKVSYGVVVHAGTSVTEALEKARASASASAKIFRNGDVVAAEGKLLAGDLVVVGP